MSSLKSLPCASNKFICFSGFFAVGLLTSGRGVYPKLSVFMLSQWDLDNDYHRKGGER